MSGRPQRAAWRSWLSAAAAVGALWVATAVVVVVATAVVPSVAPVAVDPAPGFGGWSVPPLDASGLTLLRTGLVRFDALWYLAIAADGYPATAGVPGAAAFLPGYPLVVAAVARLLGGDTVLAALAVSFASTTATVVGLRRLAALLARDHGTDADRLGRAATVVLLVFPTSFFLLAPYAESLLLASTVWALVTAAQGRPLASAALAAVATVTRPVGVLLALPLLLGVLASRQPDPARWRDPGTRRRLLRSHLLPAAGVGVGGAALLLHGWARWGDPLAVVAAQSGWQRELRSPLWSMTEGVGHALRTLADGSAPYHLLDVLVLVLTLTGVVVLARRREWPLVAHAVVSVLLWLAQPFGGRPLMSTPRFALAVPAVVLGLALLSRDDRLGAVVVPASSILLALHLVLFTRWGYVF